MKLNYTVAGTNDLAAATSFYDQLFDPSGPTKVGTTDRMTFWQGDTFAFAVALPFDQRPAERSNGSMFGFDAGSETEVTRLYEKALTLGGSCEGAPGPRGPRFSSYVRDLDGNKICFYA